MYISEQRYMIPAAHFHDGGNPAYWENWATILVNMGYLKTSCQPGCRWRTVPVCRISGPNAGPVASGIFYCPNGMLDIGPLSGYTPTGPSDAMVARAWRVQSWQNTWKVIDIWYGINAATQTDTNGDPATNTAGANELPCCTYPIRDNAHGGNSVPMMKRTTQIRKSAEVVLVYDGFFMNASQGGTGAAWRINGRHNKGKSTNLLFCDGHAGTYDRASLPQDASDFTLAKLGKAPLNVVKWRIDQ